MVKTKGSQRPPIERALDDSPEAPESPRPTAEEARALPLPHERDQAIGGSSTGGMGSGAAGARQREVLEQARKDLDAGQVDTDLRATPGMDAQRREGLVKDPKAAPAPEGGKRH